MTLKVVVYAQELKSLAKRSRQAQDNSKPQRSGDSDSDLDSSEGSDDEVKLERIQQIFVFLIYHPAICVSTPIDLQKALQSTLGLLPASQTLYFCSKATGKSWHGSIFSSTATAMLFFGKVCWGKPCPF